MPATPEDLSGLSPERVCLIKPSALGDIVNALPVLSALRARWPRARIAWVVNLSLRGLLDGHPELDEVIPFDRARAGVRLDGALAFVRFLAGLRARRFDVAIDLQGLLRSGIMTAATGAPIRVGRSDAREGSLLAYTHRIPPPRPEAHAVERLLPIATAFGAEVDPPRFVLPAPDADRDWAREVMSEVPTPRLVLNLGARWPTKRWPPARFAEVARRAAEEYGAGLVVVGAPQDRGSVDAFADHLGPIPWLDLCGRTTLPRLAAVARESDLFLSNDSGPLHLATAAGARVIGIYTCTSPALNGPYGPEAVAVRTEVPCAASYLVRCRHLSCMAELGPDRVWDAVRGPLESAAGLRAMTTPRSA